MTGEGRAPGWPGGHAGPEHALERMIFFSDAVFAIAITLLVIEIHVPRLPHGSPDAAYWGALAELLPSFMGFFISFFVIGAFWAGHHRAFLCAGHWHQRLLLPNLVLLSMVAAMPFFTAFASENPGMRVPVTLYCGWMLLVATVNIWLQHRATSTPVVDEAVPPEQIRELHRRGYAVALGAASAVVVSLFLPVVGQVPLATIPLWRRLLVGRGDRSGPSPDVA